MILNISVWESVAALKAFSYSTEHVYLLRQRADWFELPSARHLALWWIPAGHTPAVEESLARLRDLTTRARAGTLTRQDMEGGTFALSNHGVSGSLLAAPIIIPPGQAAIVGAGKLQQRVIVSAAGQFEARPMMYVTLTVDHRVLDGQQTNAFLMEFVTALENK